MNVTQTTLITREKVIEVTANRVFEAVLNVIGEYGEDLQTLLGEDQAEEFEGVIVDAAMGAVQRLASIFLADSDTRPDDLNGVAKAAAEIVQKRLERQHPEQLRALLGIDSNAN